MIFTITLNPALDKTVEVPSLKTGAVNRVAQMRTDPGGKGINVSKVIQKLGGKSIAMGILGGHTGRSIQTALTRMGLETDFIFADGETRTNLKIIDPTAHTTTDINEPGLAISGEILGGLLQRLLRRIRPGDIVVLSGSMPQGSPADTYYLWTKVLSERGAKVFLDAEGEPLKMGLAAAPYLIKPNEQEFSSLISQTLETPEQIGSTPEASKSPGDLTAAARRLMRQYSIPKIVISLGSAGALFVTAGETIYAEGLKVPVGNTAGAGDSVVAALAVAEERELSLDDTISLSMAAGAANVMCSGTQAAEADVIYDLVPKVVSHRLS
ncbi:MAG: 1-phosphofructokinase [Lachnospiraceae bacterium]|nr:1-phosphofructokinase [Lachnospiraceae bacterium]